MNLVSYLRVSTDEQAQSGLGLGAQRAALAAWPRGDTRIVSEFVDPGVSGKVAPDKRPGLAAALAFVRSPMNRCDGLVVAKLDRLSRSIKDFVTLLDQSQREGWNLVILDLGVDTSTPNGRFLAHVIASVAQLERELIGERTKAALQAKRDAGWRPDPITDAATASVIMSMRPTNTLQQIADHLNVTGVPTSRGGQTWRPSSVRSVLQTQEK